jgi:hypothetical protein
MMRLMVAHESIRDTSPPLQYLNLPPEAKVYACAFVPPHKLVAGCHQAECEAGAQSLHTALTTLMPPCDQNRLNQSQFILLDDANASGGEEPGLLKEDTKKGHPN